MRPAFDDRVAGGGYRNPTGIRLFTDGQRPRARSPPIEKDTMTSRLARLCLAVGLLVAAAPPSSALAHGGGRHHDRSRACRAVENDRVPARTDGRAGAVARYRVHNPRRRGQGGERRLCGGREARP